MKTNLKRLVCAMVFATGLGVHATVSAATDTFFDNLTDATGSPTYDYFEYVFGAPPASTNWMATPFSNSDGSCTPNCQLGAVTLKLTPINIPVDTAANLSLSIFTDLNLTATEATGVFTGTQIASLSSGVSVIDGSFNKVVFTPTSTLLLENGTTYWGVLTSNEAVGAWWGWGQGTDDGANGLGYYPDFGNLVLPTVPLALKAEVSAVPIPAAFWLMGSALLGFVLHGRRGGV